MMKQFITFKRSTDLTGCKQLVTGVSLKLRKDIFKCCGTIFANSELQPCLCLGCSKCILTSNVHMDVCACAINPVFKLFLHRQFYFGKLKQISPILMPVSSNSFSKYIDFLQQHKITYMCRLLSDAEYNETYMCSKKVTDQLKFDDLTDFSSDPDLIVGAIIANCHESDRWYREPNGHKLIINDACKPTKFGYFPEYKCTGQRYTKAHYPYTCLCKGCDECILPKQKKCCHEPDDMTLKECKCNPFMYVDTYCDNAFLLPTSKEHFSEYLNFLAANKIYNLSRCYFTGPPNENLTYIDTIDFVIDTDDEEPKSLITKFSIKKSMDQFDDEISEDELTSDDEPKQSSKAKKCRKISR